VSFDSFSDSGTFLVMDELASRDTIKDQTENPSLIIPGVPQTHVFLITPWSSCWIAGALI
jgi:hypothetical protein